jgi:osmotically-inducible protein OsmY
MLALTAVIATGIAHAQRVDDAQGRTRPDTPGQTQQQSGGGASDTSAAKTDSTDLQIRIQQAFAQDPRLANYNLGAYVSVEKVSLAGTVKSKADKAYAQEIAESMARGRAVDNEIMVDSSPNYINRPTTSTWPSDTLGSPYGTGRSSSDSSSSSSDTVLSPYGAAGASSDHSTSPSRTPPRR